MIDFPVQQNICLTEVVEVSPHPFSYNNPPAPWLSVHPVTLTGGVLGPAVNTSDDIATLSTLTATIPGAIEIPRVLS